jgi:hypothetical protein
MRSEELTNLCFEELTAEEEGVRVLIAASKTDKAGEGFDFVALASPIKWKCTLNYYNKYKVLVEKPKGRFFRIRRNGAYINQPCGRSFFLEVPKTIAKWLNKPDWKKHTGHSIRRTAATWLANAGASNVELKKFGRWKSDTVAQGYVDRSEFHKRKLATMIQGQETTESDLNQPSLEQPPGEAEAESVEPPPKRVVLKEADSVPEPPPPHQQMLVGPTVAPPFSFIGCTFNASVTIMVQNPNG